MEKASVEIPGAPAAAGVSYRRYRDERDFAGLAAAINACSDADGLERCETAESLAVVYTHLYNSDLINDLVLVEAGGRIVGYARVWWELVASDASRIYGMVGYLEPEHRGKGVGRALLRWAEARLRAIAASHPPEAPKCFEAFIHDGERAKAELLESSGYAAARFFYEMVRPSLSGIPDYQLPEGVELRPARPEQYRAIWDAWNEAFKDHWGFSEPTEAEYERWLADARTFQPELWQVAWDLASNRVAGHVLGYVDREENAKLGRSRGYTERIGVLRAWRRRGLARAMIARSLRAQAELGMAESALHVDGESQTGATRVYADCGFRVAKTNTVYRKPL